MAQRCRIETRGTGGKLHDAVKDCMVETGMLEKSARLAMEARAKGVNIFHAPISFAADASDNPNKGLGILAGCAADSLFTENTWNADVKRCDRARDLSCMSSGARLRSGRARDRC